MKLSYKSTINACFIGYITGAIINCFVPLLFVTFQSIYNIPLSQITLLITINFAIQLTVDMVSALFIDKIGYRASIVIAHICCTLGLVALTILPEIMPTAFMGIVCSVAIYAIGGGLLEVLISPITEACPSENKEKAMSLLHSFYCWGCVGVVLISTVFFKIFGIENWKILILIWATIPTFNAIFFSKVPIYSLTKDGESGLTIKELLKTKVFWVFAIMMTCAGASEQAISQWASVFAEQGLGVSKAIGDLAGPMAFSVLMGLARLIYGKYGEKINLDKFMSFSCILCIICYLSISLIPNSITGLIGCAISGFAVGIMWPGTFSKASATIKNGGTIMFAFLALAGDLGCSVGPTIAGLVSSNFNDNLRIGIFTAVIFPAVLFGAITLLKKYNKPRIKK